MNIKISERVDKVANYIIKSNKTVREISKVFHVSKSTIHKDLHDRLKLINKEKYKEVISYQYKTYKRWRNNKKQIFKYA